MRRVPQLRRFLQRRGFKGFVIERAIDRVIHAAMQYLRQDGNAKPCALRNRVSWLFTSALKAARQEAAREPRCEFVDPVVLVPAVAAEQSTDTDAVWIAMDRLTNQQRAAVYYCIVIGLTLAEAAAEMGCLPTGVMRHRDRGLHQLRRILSDDTPVH